MYEIPKLSAPAIQLTGGKGDPNTTTLAEWIRPIDKKDIYDLCLLGAPLSKSSISFSGAHLHPLHFRKLWPAYSTYHWDEDIELHEFSIADLGDVEMHITDIDACHQNIAEAMFHVQSDFPDTTTITVGGDHSITAPLVKGMQKARNKRIGIIQFDAHLDVRVLKVGGASNGTPMRNLIQSNTVRGDDIVTIGLRNFANSRQYRDYAESMGMELISYQAVQRQGIEAILTKSINKLSQQCDEIYVTFDIDALHQSAVPGVPALGPQGLSPEEVFSSAITLGKCPKVKAIDLVCVDPTVDFRDLTTRLSLHVFLYFCTGYALRLNG